MYNVIIESHLQTISRSHQSRVLCAELSYANCMQFLTHARTHVYECASHKPISALSSVAHDDMCFPVVRQPRRCRISHPISRKGRISVRYRRAQILIQSTCIHIDALTAPRGWNCAAMVYRVYTCNPERSVLGDAVRLSSECPIWKFMGYPICALNTPLYMRRAFQYIVTPPDSRWRCLRSFVLAYSVLRG